MPRRLLLVITLGFAAIAAPSAQPGARQPVYDLVIRNGRVLDGMGNPWIRADVAIGTCQDATLDDAATYENPRATPQGIDYVLVNGAVVIDHGRHAGARPGRVLCGSGRTP